MKRRSDILSYFGNTHKEFLHSHGEAATRLLLQKLQPQNFENILEVGTGTGATLVKIAAKNKHTNLFGLEKSELMLKTTKARLEFCKISQQVKLNKIGEDGRFPYMNDSFDKIYIESVLAIQEGKELEESIEEIHRVLKPGGILIINETVWLSSVSQKEIDKINKYCKERFGIIQASGKYKYVNEWCHLLESHCICVTDIQKLALSKQIDITESKKLIEYLSGVFSLIGKLKGKLSSTLRQEMSVYKKDMKNIYEDKQYLETLLFICTKRPE